jgi:hypothetical protein
MENDIVSRDLYILEIQKLNNKIDILNNRLENHINLIENIYNGIKKPLFFIMNRINNIFLLNDK